MRRVMIESPLAAATEEQRQAHVQYAARALLDSIQRGEAPLAMHLLYPMVLDDGDPDQRALGMACAKQYYPHVEAVVFYTDHGMSPGMKVAQNIAMVLGLPVEWRSLGCE